MEILCSTNPAVPKRARERDGDGSKSAGRLTLSCLHAGALSGVSRGDAAGTKQAEQDGKTRENGDQSYFETC